MKFAHIVPIANLENIRGQEYSMFLTHLVEKYPEYKQFAKEAKGFKILDNSLIELGDAVSLDRVMYAAHEIEADEFVLPDKFLDKDVTLQRVTKALDTLKSRYTFSKEYSFKLMAVVQGKNEEEWFKCFEELNKIDEITTLGIPKVLSTLHPWGRPYFIRNMPKTDKEIHLLGVWETITELGILTTNDIKKIRGVDSSLPAVLALNQKSGLNKRHQNDIIDLERDVVYDYSMRCAITEVNDYVENL